MIYINEKIRIRKLDDGKNLQLEEYRQIGDCRFTKQSGGKWYWCGYYGDLKSALLGALSKQLFDSVDDELDLKDIVSKIDDARAEIVKAIKGVNKG